MFATFALAAALALAPQQAEMHDPAVEAAIPTAAQGPADVAHPEQAHAPEAHAPDDAHGAGEAHGEEEHGFDILHHILDSRTIETPFGVVNLPPAGSWMVGPLDMTPTKHVVFLGLTALVVILIFLWAARRSARTGPQGAPRRGHNAIEALVLFLREKVVLANTGHGGEKYAPFVITLFFFILVANLLGLLPYGATATGNVSVTAALAVMAFVMIEVAGMRAQGVGYLNTVVYWNRDLPFPIRVALSIIMTPVEILGKLTKPFALAIRLFANMTAGHVLLLAIIGLIFLFGSYAIAVGPVVMAVALTFLEIFVAFLQAYIFALLTSVFIGLIMHAH
jgi:F-type H+-transporting ATPase subunit a